jgi:hypothetical protein
MGFISGAATGTKLGYTIGSTAKDILNACYPNN